MPTAILDQTTELILKKREPEYRERTRELSEYLRHLEVKSVVENQVFLKTFEKSAYQVRQEYWLKDDRERDEIRAVNRLAAEMLERVYANNLVEEVLKYKGVKTK